MAHSSLSAASSEGHRAVVRVGAGAAPGVVGAGAASAGSEVQFSEIWRLPSDSSGRPLNFTATHMHDDSCTRLCWWHRPPRSCVFGQLCDGCHHESHYARPREQRRSKIAARQQQAAGAHDA
mmetsp:Transcript_44082/g.126265  ORF Transcript_44082/g.126265 Transcript_44082/m.126265 type:complete len:122 (-) Transcript_44082:263-628(-)